VFSVIVLLLIGVSASAQQPGGPQLGTFVRPTNQQGTLPIDNSPTVVRAINVFVDTKQLITKNSSLTLVIFDNQRLDLVLNRIEEIPRSAASSPNNTGVSGTGPSAGALTWYGRVADEPHSSAILTLVGQTVTGNIDTESGKVYQIRYVGGAVHSFREIDRTKFPNEAEPLRPEIQPSPPFLADTCATDPPTDIDALVVYTPAARMAAGGQDAMEGTVYLAVAETNQSYLNSNINQRLRLAHVEEVSYTETGNSSTDLTRLQNGSDGFMDDVPTLRNTFAADTVSLITETLDACGLGSFMSTVSNSFESRAYSVVKRSCATGNYSFGHELGHNMGADHDAANAGGGTSAYAYDHGFFNTSPTAPATPWRTVMSYQTSPASTRVQYWSNPNVNYPIGGDPMGDAATADNHRVLNNTALTVANFRCSSPTVTNVWMKDTWDDTGLEPDPGTASEDMWKSPYIWVRNTQDTNLVNQHEHQNPEFGSTNWVYVKVHNGGATAASGNLELYWANASTSLIWPGSWTLLSSVPVSGFAAHSTRVVEVPWNSLPGSGHFCLLARWNSSADRMATPEGPDINANVRANNNLVWRNLNIVDLLPDARADVAVNVANPDRGNRAVTLTIRSQKIRENPSFLAVGEVLVTFDDTLLKAWRQGGGQGTGFAMARIPPGAPAVLFSSTFAITDPDRVTFENLILPNQTRGSLMLTFRRLPETPKIEYIVDVVEELSVMPGAPTRVVGGVSYEIHTDRDNIEP